MAAIQHPLGRAHRGSRRVPFSGPESKPNWWVISAAAILGASAVLPVLQNSAATSRGFDIRQSQAAQTQIQGEINGLEAEVARLTSMDRVERRAKEIGLGPSLEPPIYVTVDAAGPQAAKLPSEYLPPPAPPQVESVSWWRSLVEWLPLPN